MYSNSCHKWPVLLPPESSLVMEHTDRKTADRFFTPIIMATITDVTFLAIWGRWSSSNQLYMCTHISNTTRLTCKLLSYYTVICHHVINIILSLHKDSAE